MVRGLVGCRFLGVRASDLVTAFSQSHAKPTLHHSRLSKSRRWTLNDLDRRRATAGSCQAEKQNQDESRLRWWSGIVGVAPDEVPECRNEGEGDEDDRRIIHGGSHDGHGGWHAEQRYG